MRDWIPEAQDADMGKSRTRSRNNDLLMGLCWAKSPMPPYETVIALHNSSGCLEFAMFGSSV